MTDAAESPAGALRAGERVVAGDIAARIDRLPLTRIQYGYAAVTQWFWGIIIAADGMVAGLYPYIWAPKNLITSFQFDLILGANIGVGILIGEYLGGFMSDLIGRKMTLILAALIEGLFIWPIALTNSFGWLLLWNALFALGMGMLLAVHAVYLHELAPPPHRQKLALRTPCIAPAAAGLLAGVTSYYWVPVHYQWWIYSLSAAPIVLCIPLGLMMPESPRWLEGKGRTEAADKIVSKWERATERRFGPLPPPNLERHTVIQTKRVPASEVFQSRYRYTTVVLLAVWFLGYSGIVYGGGGFFPTWAVAHGWSAHELFFFSRILQAPIAIIVFFFVAAFGERFERKSWILGASVGYSICFLLLFAFSKGFAAQATLISLATPFTGIWLFSCYNYTAAAYPTRVRSVGTGWTDGVGHLGTIVGTSLLVGRLFTWRADHSYYGWILYITIAGAIVPSLLIFFWGQRQKAASWRNFPPNHARAPKALRRHSPGAMSPSAGRGCRDSRTTEFSLESRQEVNLRGNWVRACWQAFTRRDPPRPPVFAGARPPAASAAARPGSAARAALRADKSAEPRESPCWGMSEHPCPTPAKTWTFTVACWAEDITRWAAAAGDT
jgi:MFS family permease